MLQAKKHIKDALTALDCLTVYRHIRADLIMQEFHKTLELSLAEDPEALKSYFKLIGCLSELPGEKILPGLNLFKNHLINTILTTETVFSRDSEKLFFSRLDKSFLKLIESDLASVKSVYDFDFSRLFEQLKEKYKLDDLAMDLNNLNFGRAAAGNSPAFYFQKVDQIKKVLAESSDWRSNIEELYDFYRDAGSGEFGRYWAFKWSSNGNHSGLVGVVNPDPIRMEDLVGLEDQQEEIIRNTRQFIAGLPANNILLYGDRGTGKSSTIKSLIHIFGSEGLRLIEISKHDILNLHRVIRLVRGRGQKFVIFIDDLSFEENETAYKELKALLEGSIEKPPENVLVYATSNRKNLIREYFSDREAGEVGTMETYQEKLSLADRFGIKLVFPTPGQKEYLDTVAEIARNSGIDMDRSKLDKLALEWVMWHNSRSGRTARQFVNDLIGRLKFEK